MLIATLLALAAPEAVALPDDFKFDLEGYYRTRGYVLGGMYDGQEEAGRRMVHRLRVQPTLNFEDRAKFFMMMDFMDDVVWGDNMSQLPTSVFAQDPSNNTFTDGSEVDFFGRNNNTFKLKRAWMEFKVPVGVVRVGRQESHWGMGLLSNHGNGFDDTYGENHLGSTFDRVVFATRPIAIAQSIAGKADTGIPFFVAVGVDRLVEDPLDIYYGYKCSPGLVQGTDPTYDSRCDTGDPTGGTTPDGITDLDHDYIDDTRTADQRGTDWWIDNKDDAWEIVLVAVYRGEGLNWGGKAADFTMGAYGIMRQHEETASDVLIADAYAKLLYRGIYFESEVLHIRGRTSGLALPGAFDEFSDLPNPLYKEANIWGYVARGGYQQESWSAVMETGFASGDDNVADDKLTVRALHPDYNVGLILYEEVMARVTATTWTDAANPLWSQGGVWSSRYIFPTLTWKPMKNWELLGSYLMAWPHKPDGSRILCQASDEETMGIECADPKTGLARELGWEVDAAVKHRFHEHILFSMEGAYAKVSNRVPLENLGLNPKGQFWTFQSRIAYEF